MLCQTQAEVAWYAWAGLFHNRFIDQKNCMCIFRWVNSNPGSCHMSCSHNMADSLWKICVLHTVHVQCNLLLNFKNLVTDEAAAVSSPRQYVKTPGLQEIHYWLTASDSWSVQNWNLCDCSCLFPFKKKKVASNVACLFMIFRGVYGDVGNGGCWSASTMSLVLALFLWHLRLKQMINFALVFFLCAYSVALLRL